MLSLLLFNILYSFLILVVLSLFVHVFRNNLRALLKDTKLIDIIGESDDESYSNKHGFLAYLFLCGTYIAFMIYAIAGLGFLIYMGLIWGRK